MKLGACWLNFPSKHKNVRPTYQQSQRHTYSFTTGNIKIEWKTQHLYGWMKTFSGLRKRTRGFFNPENVLSNGNVGQLVSARTTFEIQPVSIHYYSLQIRFF